MSENDVLLKFIDNFFNSLNFIKNQMPAVFMTLTCDQIIIEVKKNSLEFICKTFNFIKGFNLNDNKLLFLKIIEKIELN